MKGGKTPIHMMRWAPSDFVNDPSVKLALHGRKLAAVAFWPLFLFHSFMEGGSLPAEVSMLAAVVGMREADVKHALTFWRAQMTADGVPKLDERDGRLFNHRVLRDLGRALEVSDAEKERVRRWRESRTPYVQGTNDVRTHGVHGPMPLPLPLPLPLPVPERTNGQPPINRPAIPGRDTAVAELAAASADLDALWHRPSVSNPLIAAGDRQKLEVESLQLTRAICKITGEDGPEVMASASHYEGAKRQKVNPATMSDDRLLNTVLDLRATLKGLKADAARKESRARREEPDET